MKLTKKQLSLIIESFIHEGDWLSDEDDIEIDVIENTDDKIKSAFNSAKKKVVSDLRSADISSQNITQELLEDAINIINKTHLHIVEQGDTKAKYKGVNAIAFHSSYGDKDGNKRDVLHYDEIPDDIDIGSAIKKAFQEDSLNNPVVVVFKLYVESKNKKEIFDLLYHEVGHIKNSAIKALSEKTGSGPKNMLNVSEVKSVLRKDLLKGSPEQIAEYILFHENPKRIDRAMRGANDLVLILSRYYKGIFKDPPDNLGVEEFSVRISALKNNPQALEDFKSGQRKYEYFSKKYNTDIADIMIFISEEATIDNVNKIVKAQSLQKSATA